MSDTMDECRAHVAEQRHERGDCDSNCSFCDEPETYMCSCGQPADYDIHCKRCLFEGLYSNACTEIQRESGMTHEQWLSSAQMFEAEIRAERELDRLLKGLPEEDD